VVAWLERDVQRRAARAVSALVECDDFRVVGPIVLVEAFAEDGAIFDDHATNRGIGARQANAFRGKVQRVLHEVLIVSIHGVS
jgi:hypothetical protein